MKYSLKKERPKAVAGAIISAVAALASAAIQASQANQQSRLQEREYQDQIRRQENENRLLESNSLTNMYNTSQQNQENAERDMLYTAKRGGNFSLARKGFKRDNYNPPVGGIPTITSKRGRFIPIGDGMNYIVGPSHEQGGINVDFAKKGGKYKRGVEVEGDEVEFNDGHNMYILSAQPQLGAYGLSPAELATNRIVSKEQAFNIQEANKNPQNLARCGLRLPVRASAGLHMPFAPQTLSLVRPNRVMRLGGKKSQNIQDRPKDDFGDVHVIGNKYLIEGRDGRYYNPNSFAAKYPAATDSIMSNPTNEQAQAFFPGNFDAQTAVEKHGLALLPDSTYGRQQPDGSITRLNFSLIPDTTMARIYRGADVAPSIRALQRDISANDSIPDNTAITTDYSPVGKWNNNMNGFLNRYLDWSQSKYSPAGLVRYKNYYENTNDYQFGIDFADPNSTATFSLTGPYQGIRMPYQVNTNFEVSANNQPAQLAASIDTPKVDAGGNTGTKNAIYTSYDSGALPVPDIRVQEPLAVMPISDNIVNTNASIPTPSPAISAGGKQKFSAGSDYSDLIGAGISALGSLASAAISARAYRKTKAPDKPVLFNPGHLASYYNIRPQLSEIERQRQATNRAVLENTASSAAARSLIAKANTDAVSAANQQWGTKTNREIEMRNADVTEQNRYHNKNVNRLNRWSENVTEFNNQRRLGIANSWINGIKGVAGAANQYFDNIRTAEENRFNGMTTLAGANPEVFKQLVESGVNVGDVTYRLDPTKMRWRRYKRNGGRISMKHNKF